MNAPITKYFFVLLSFVLILGSCKNEGGNSTPSPNIALLTRDNISLAYTTSTDWQQQSFATLDENTNPPYVFSWDQAKINSSIIHFGLTGASSLIAPDQQNAPLIYNDGFNNTKYGVSYWTTKKGLTFDSQVANVDFDALSGKIIDENVPDAGFGNFETLVISIQKDQIIRFIYRDTNNNLKYKGYIKVIATNNGNPKTASVTVKYIAK